MRLWCRVRQRTTARGAGGEAAASVRCTHAALCAFLMAFLPLAAPAAPDHPSALSARVSGAKATIKRDTKAVGAVSAELAHRIAGAAKSFAHEVSKAATRGGTEIRAVFKGTGSGTGENRREQ